MKYGNVIISEGNSKLGKIPNVSLTPGILNGCPNGARCYSECYARKFLYRPGVSEAWAGNLHEARVDLARYMRSIGEFLTEKKPKFFRWHTAGDILSAEYLEWMKRLALQHPGTRFLCFTKMYRLFPSRRKQIPDNLKVIFSLWPRLLVPRACAASNLGRAYVKFPENKANLSTWQYDAVVRQAERDGRSCSGHCDTCKTCWTLPWKANRARPYQVVFKLH